AGHSSVVNQHRAAAAQALRAALARAEEIEAIAQHFDDGVVGRDLGCDFLAVEGEMDGAGHAGLTVAVAEQPRVGRTLLCPFPLREGAAREVQHTPLGEGIKSRGFPPSPIINRGNASLPSPAGGGGATTTAATRCSASISLLQRRALRRAQRAIDRLGG